MRMVAGLLLVALLASAQEPFAPLSDADAWKQLPPRAAPQLPEWARRLAESLPKTTARLLELDHLHRADNPLGARFAARVRWTVADALGCAAGRAEAQADLDRAPPKTHPGEAAALAFAKQLTLAGHAITDAEFATLLKSFSPAEVVALVHTVAYANFQNRIVLGLGVGDVPPLPPVGVNFDTTGKSTAPKRPAWDDLKAVKEGGLAVRAEWDTKADLAGKLEKQKARPARIPAPPAEAFKELTGRDRQQADKIAWMTLSSGYQPRLTKAWFACLAAYYEEAQVDRVFTNSVFWVVTRTNDCFY